jgi:undecaprenyl diphosphate synthase
VTTPAHIAIIMDGNGRWAKARGLPRTAGHKKGADSLRATIEACRKLGVRYLTVYAFSSENWKRPSEEVNDLMELLKYHLGKELKTLCENDIRLRFIGNRAKLSADIQAMLQEAENISASNTALTFTTALSYGGREELARAATKLIASAPESISPEMLDAALDTAGLPDPDLLIRTGGEQRLSNFLLWQLAYTELYFTDVLWPEFTPEHLEQAITTFHTRERRYGNAS